MHRRVKNALFALAGLALAALGVTNVVMKATWTMMDDGVFWKTTPQGLMAARIASTGPGASAGIRTDDVLVAVDGEEVLSPARLEQILAGHRPGERLVYSLLRLHERRGLDLEVQPLPQGNVSAFYYLSLVGFFSLVVGTVVMLRRPADRSSLHFYAVCVLFFLTYSTSFTGRLDRLDWVFVWTDRLAVLFLPVVYLHFCLSFPDRRLRAQHTWIVPALYMPALVVTGASVMSHMLLADGEQPDALWKILETIDRVKPLYFALLFALAVGVLARSYRRTRSLIARRQVKWLLWGTASGVVPFLAFYALPFALRPAREPGLALQLVGYGPLALIPLSLAYAVVKHRLMDVELIFRRGLGYVLALAVILAFALLTAGLTDRLWEEPHATLIALLSALVVVLLFTPVKARIQEALEKLSYKERYSSRKALVRLSEDLNADLDLERTCERLLEGVGAALGLREMVLFLPGEDGAMAPFRARGVPRGESPRLRDGRVMEKLHAGQAVDVEAAPDEHQDLAAFGLAWLFPCRVKGEVIAVLGVGRKEGLDPLNSEEVDVLKTVAAQAGSAILNGRLFRTVREKADELRGLKEYNENILESLDSGIVVLDLEGRVVRWNRAMEALDGRQRLQVLGRTLDAVFPEAFLDALRGSLVLGDREEIAHIYKLHLPSSDGRSLMVNVAVAPFQSAPGERCGTILILDDVTARVRLEEQLQHAEKMASVGLLAAGVAHEVNTPLAGITSYTQLLRGQLEEKDPRQQVLEKIEKQSFRAAKIINGLLNFSRSSGTEFERVDVNKALADVLSLLEHQLDGSKIRVRRELTSELPSIRGNENRVQQVFFNLVLNARDAMPSGGWLTVATSCENDTVVVELHDTGHGIRREHIKRIYDPFFTTKGIGKGTGLGLSVSYGIVQEHGGAIFVDSAPGQGTTFRVTFPALAHAEAARQQG